MAHSELLTPKRRKLTHHSSKGYDSNNDSGDELFSDFPDTIPTQPLPVSQRPQIKSSFKTGHTFSDIMSSLQPSPRQRQPTQPSSSPLAGSSPRVLVSASSPQPSPQPPTRFRSVASAMAPPGTSFRPPVGVKCRPPSDIIDLSSFDDPPVDQASADEDDNLMQSSIKPTTFTKAPSSGTNSSPIRVDESPRPTHTEFSKLTSQYAYNASGSATARPVSQVARQIDVARAELEFVADAFLAHLEETDFHAKMQVKYMHRVHPDTPYPVLYGAFIRKKRNVNDASDWIAEQELALSSITDESVLAKVKRMRTILFKVPVERLHGTLKDHDLHFDNAVDQLLVETGERPSPKAPTTSASKLLVPKAKQQVSAPIKSIADKWGSKIAKPSERSPAKSNKPYNQDHPIISDPASPVVAKPRRRLIQRRRLSQSPPNSPPPARVDGPSRNRAVISIDSDSDDDNDGIVAPETVVSNAGLLKFFNTCSALELADLANEKEEVAAMILSRRPFRTLELVRHVSEDEQPKSSKKRPIGDRILDCCEAMWTGYEAVDSLVQKCESLGKPIRDAMKDWGIDLQSALTDGELAAIRVDETHDSGIGTPTSINTADEELSPTKHRPATYLKQPAIMNPELTMKDYQVFGLNWLNLLWSKRLSCILADDMGLGKTCQVVSLFAHLSEIGVRGTHLVIVPGSTLENWLREFRRFCPDLRVEPYYGSQKDREEQRAAIEDDLDEIDVVVTTYETAVSQKVDNRFLRKTVEPKVCVFDEGHALKNSNTKRHQELMRIPAEFRILLTGTPLQNNLQELVSLLSFILPQVFDEQREELEAIFRYKATTKDTDHAALLSAQRIQRARSMMTPFILRRKKQQVLKDIPAKHRRVEYCDMVDSQMSLWATCVAAMKKAQAGPAKGKGKSVHMMTLRQAALHPLLTRRIYNDDKLRELQDILLTHPRSEFLDNRSDLMWKYLSVDIKGGDYGLHRFCAERADYIPTRYTLTDQEWMQSGKVQQLEKLMTKFINNGDRVLLFSQFTSMLDILEAVFETLSIKFMRLDGSTQMAQRQDMIDQFTEDQSIPVFMLSTKAGGAGINLACANKVIIFDSSFNPQDDIQAENRAHRVGQTREVDVVRLITRGTIEEMIHALGESKLTLDQRVAEDADDKQAEKEREKMVEQMFLESLS